MKKLLKLSSVITAFAIVSAMLTATVFADSTAPQLSVTGSGQLKVAPDIAYLNVGVRTSAKEAADATKENTAKTNSIIEKLTALGIDKKDIKTQYFNIYPTYDYSQPSAKETVTGYEVNNSLTVTIRKIDQVGTIIDSLIDTGANVMNGLSYGVEFPSVYYDSLYEKAMNDANKKASSIAKSMGVSLTAPVAISENGYFGAAQSYVNADLSIANSAAGVRQFSSNYITPGEIELNASLMVIYQYK